MTAIAFADAVRQPPARILRLPMQPYSLGHEIILLSERNPLAILSPDEFDKLPLNDRLRATIRACLICSRSWEENKISFKWLRLWSWLNRKSDFLKAAHTFQSYRANGSTFPLPPDKESDEIANGKSEDGRQMGGDLLTRLAGFIATRFKDFGFSSAYDFPFGFAVHLYFTDLEIKGRMRIENDKERQIREEMQGHRAAIRSKREKAKK